MKPTLSVIICTHNPKSNYLERVLSALSKQTLPKNLWELLLIDNASEKNLASEIDLSWHPQSRHIREEELGLTLARLRGIKEAIAETLVFVDDDNVLDSDYLEFALKISIDFSIIGAWGGQIRPELEEEPPEWIKPDLKKFLEYLGCREFVRDKWSNLLHEYQTTPCGAGLCVRKFVAEKYAELVRNHPIRASLGRKGKQLTSGEDYDLIYTSCDLGLGTGLFTCLKMIHLIPPHRLEEDYMLQLRERIAYSITIVEHLRVKRSYEITWRAKIYQKYLRLRYGSKKFRFEDAEARGMRLALEEISSL